MTSSTAPDPEHSADPAAPLERPAPRSTRRGSSIAARLFLAVGVPAAVVVVALGALAWRTTSNAVEESLRRELASSVAVAASTIRPASLRTLLREEEATARSYKNTQARLRGIQRSTGSVRVLVIDANETVRGSADNALHIGDPAPRVALDRVEIQRALAGTAAVSVPFTADDGKRYMAAYAVIPEARDEAASILDEEGAKGPPLLLAMEAPAAALDATDDVARRIAALVAIAVAVVLSLALIVARTITRPLFRLAAETERLGRGELKQALVLPPGDDEVAALGHTLEQMRHALVERDAERQMMLAGIAHEIRNPLGGMELFSGLLEEGIAELPTDVPAPVKAELADQAGRVRKELRYLTDVVNSFLAFARDTPLVREPVDIPGLLDDVASLCRREGRAPIDVDGDSAGSADMDRGRIKQALLNLVENALAATPVDGKVSVRARRVAAPPGSAQADRLVLEVQDTGKGMEPHTLARAWQPFFTTKEKGSGLGLPLVKKLARDHGGDAEVESVVGQGTIVRIWMPV